MPIEKTLEEIYLKLLDIETYIAVSNSSKPQSTISAEDEFLTLKEIVSILKMAPSSISYHRKFNDMPFHNPGKKILFKRKEIEAWVLLKTKKKSNANGISVLLNSKSNKNKSS